MEVTNTQASQSAALSASASEQSAAVLSSDFEVFLQMLTAQARYQDPLEPMDSSEYAAQLAQFSMVEQQVQSNDLLRLLSFQLDEDNIGQSAGWIGMDARTAAPVPYDGAPLTVTPSTRAGADEAFLIAYDADGKEMGRQQISTGADPVEWAGRADNGSALPEGLYSFKVEHRSAGEVLGVTPAETYARITEAQRIGGSTVFVLNGGSIVTSSDISALREPG